MCSWYRPQQLPHDGGNQSHVQILHSTGHLLRWCGNVEQSAASARNSTFVRQWSLLLGCWVRVDAPPSGRSRCTDSEVTVTCMVLHQADHKATAVYLLYAPWSVNHFCMLNALLAVIPKAWSWEFADAHGLPVSKRGFGVVY